MFYSLFIRFSQNAQGPQFNQQHKLKTEAVIQEESQVVACTFVQLHPALSGWGLSFSL